jgi:hypothetical protein
MSSVIRYDLINFYLKEPVDVHSCDCPAYPMVRRLLLCPRQTNVNEPWPLREQNKVVAFVEIDTQNQLEATLQDNIEGFMIWVCWLLSLAELHDVYFWGAHHYLKEASTWNLRSSVCKPTIVSDWKPDDPHVFEGAVIYWRLSEFLSKGLRLFSDNNFPTKEFTLALQLFLDSLPTRQFAEMRFVKKWTAFESLINDQAEKDGYLYIFGKRGSDEFSSLRSELKLAIDANPSVIARPETNEPLTRQLSAVERMPVKTIAKRFLNDLSINFDEHDLIKTVDTRNDILHYIKTDTGLEEVRRLDKILHRLLSETFCRKLDWNMENELQVNYAQPYNEPLPDYVMLSNAEVATQVAGSGHIESTDGQHPVDCEGTLTWNRDDINGQFVSRDLRRFDIMGLSDGRTKVKVVLNTSDGGTALVHGGLVIHVDMGARATVRGGPLQNFEISFGVIGLKLFRQMPATAD